MHHIVYSVSLETLMFISSASTEHCINLDDAILRDTSFASRKCQAKDRQRDRAKDRATVDRDRGLRLARATLPCPTPRLTKHTEGPTTSMHPMG